ncbi:MAG: GNAT family N-acetyltransferase [Rubrivivax sp.]|nr:GNAT family N-acetyltransferase [Rubrivivax sp.]MDH5338585.1 GNAT family N-acetyltransferase [Rubrivivax sp.]
MASTAIGPDMKKKWTRQARPDDIAAVIALQRRVYPTIPPWEPAKLRRQFDMFPQGQVVAETEAGLVGYAGSLVVAWDDWAESHTWSEITGAGTFEHHNPAGRTLYGAEVFVGPQMRGGGVGHLLYEARRKICKAMNLKRIIACGRLPGYGQHADALSAEAYAQRVVWGDLRDPVLSFQLREGFSYCGVIEGYIPEDVESRGYASIIVWLNPSYNPAKPTRIVKEVSL